jgi:Cu/Ag efflux pump CusA
VLAGAAEPIVVRVFGSDLKTLRSQADRVRAAPRNVDGLEDLHTELAANVPEIEVTEHLAAARRYGLKPGDVRRAAATLISSEEVGDIQGRPGVRRPRLEHTAHAQEPDGRSRPPDRHARRRHRAPR